MVLRLRSVLVATDLAEGSDVVMQAAVELAGAAGAELHAIHSLEIPPLEYARSWTLEDDVAYAERGMEAQVERTGPPGMELRSRMVSLRAADAAILDRARDVGADAIVLGSHRGTAAGRLLGTTADRVARRATVPCLIVNAPLTLPLRHVVAAYDFSEPAEAALAEAAAWTVAFGPEDEEDISELLAVHVLRPLQPLGESFVDMDEVGGMLEGAMASAQRDLGVGTSAGAGRVTTRGEVSWSGPVDDTLAEYGSGADLLVIGTRGKGSLQRMLLGSIASSVARRAACPVLLVPPARALEWKAASARGPGGDRIPSRRVPVPAGSTPPAPV